MFELKGDIRKFVAMAKSGLATLRMTFNESLAVALVEGQGDEMTRAGLRFSFGFKTGVTGIAPVQTIPSTAAQWLLWNPAANANTVYIDELGVVLVSGTAGAGIVLLGGKVFSAQAPTTVPTSSAANMGTNNRGLQSASSSQLVVASGQTLAAGPANLELVASGISTNTAILSVAAYNNQVYGNISIPPGSGYALYVTSPAGTTPLYAPVGVYRELPTPNQ